MKKTHTQRDNDNVDDGDGGGEEGGGGEGGFFFHSREFIYLFNTHTIH